MRWPARVLRYALITLFVVVTIYLVSSIRLLQQQSHYRHVNGGNGAITMKERFVAAAAAWMDGNHATSGGRTAASVSTNRGLSTVDNLEGRDDLIPFEDDNSSSEDDSKESIEYEMEMNQVMKEMNDTGSEATTGGDDEEDDEDLDEEDLEEDPEEADDEDIAAMIAASGASGAGAPDEDEDAEPAPPSNPMDMFQRIRPSQFDIVYTYVNKSMSKTITSQFKAAKKGLKATDSRSAKSARYRDRGELCFSMRSVEKFLPWFTGNIHIVTSTIPEWLDTSHPRIRVVTEESIMKEEHLPTYNSMAVEASIPKIRDLNDFYLYFNDDFFLARETPFEAFTGKDNKCNVFYPLPDDLNKLPNKGPHRAALHNANKLIDRHFGLKKPRTRYDLAHIPHVFNTSLVRHIASTFNDELEQQSSHQFRSKADLHMAHLYAYYLRESPNDGCTQWKTVKPKCDGKGPYCFSYKAGLRNFHRELTGLKNAAKKKSIPNFINLNDREADPRLAAVAQKWTYEFLVRLYPKPSSFEKYDCRRHYRHFPISKYDLDEYKKKQAAVRRARAKAIYIRRMRAQRKEEARLERMFGNGGRGRSRRART